MPAGALTDDPHFPPLEDLTPRNVRRNGVPRSFADAKDFERWRNVCVERQVAWLQRRADLPPWKPPPPVAPLNPWLVTCHVHCLEAPRRHEIFYL